MLNVLQENKNVDLYLDNDATGEKYTKSFLKIAQVYRYCLENGMATDWDLNALKGSKNKIGKLIASLGIKSFQEKQIWKIQVPIWDRRAEYRSFKDLNDYLNLSPHCSSDINQF